MLLWRMGYFEIDITKEFLFFLKIFNADIMSFASINTAEGKTTII